MTDDSLNLPLELARRPRRAALARGVVPLGEVDRPAWQALCASRVEGNPKFEPGFALAAAGVGGGTRALTTGADGRLTGLLPVTSAWRAWHLPMPMLVAKRSPYSVLGTPLLDAGDPIAAADGLIEAAKKAGAAVLAIQDLPLEGAAAAALEAAMRRRGRRATVDNVRQRGALDATVDAETYLQASLGGKKLRELRRQMHRLAEQGAIAFTEAVTVAEVGAAVERFLGLEASGWKGARGTAMAGHVADAAFIRSATRELASSGGCSMLELTLDGATIAAGLVLRQGDCAMFFKIAFDERYARCSPGVQLTLELTRRLCADPAIRVVDSCADEGHPLIDHIWRERMSVGDFYMPLGSGPAAGISIRLAVARRRLRQAVKSLHHRLRSMRTMPS